MALQPHSRIESQLTDPTYKGPYLSRIELILKDMLENYGRIAFVGPYDTLEDLPETGQAGYVYLVRVEGSNLCDEYIWDEQEEEYNYVGRFEIDLDAYATKAEVEEIRLSISNLSASVLLKQSKELETPITVDQTIYTTVEAAMNAMNISLSGKISTSNTPGHVMNDGTIDQTEYEKSGVAESLVKDTVGWSGKNLLSINNDVCFYRSGTFTKVSDNSFTITRMAYGASNIVNVIHPVEHNTDYAFDFVGTEGIFKYGIKFVDEIPVQWQNMSNMVKSGNSGSNNYVVIGFEISAGDTTQIETISNLQLEHGLISTSFEPYHATVDTGKADKVTNATSGHLAGLDSNGNLTDSGVSPTEEVTVEGNPVTFDSPFEQDAKSVVVSVKPIQDLHGLPFPYVGGAYKNKLPLVLADIKAANTSGTWSGNVYSVANGTVEILVDNANNVTGMKLNGTFTSQLFFVLGNAIDFEAGMKLNGWPSGVTNGALVMNNTANYDTGNGVTLTLSGNGAGLLQTDANATFSNAVVYPMLRLSTESDATFAPYSNICPISGIDEVEIGVSGKNLCPNLFEQGAIQSGVGNTYTDNKVSSDTRIRSTNLISLDNRETYTVSCDFSKYEMVLMPYDKNGIAIQGSGVWGTWQSSAFQISGLYYCAIAIRLIGQGTISPTDYADAKPQIELGSTPTAYEPYKGSTTTIPLPSTLYDADVDVTEGSATEPLKMVDLGTLNWHYDEPNRRFYTDTIPDAYLNANNESRTGFCICSDYKTFWHHETYDENWDGVAYVAWWEHNPLHVFMVHDHRYTDAATFKNAVSGVQFLYQITTPTTISLTPTDVELLEGTNVVSTNAEKVAVTYKAGILATLGDIDDLNDKVKTKFDKANVATIEPRSTASKTYYKGDYIVRSDGCLYDVTATIASGAAFTNNNTHKTNLGDELNKFKVYVSTANSPVNGNDVASVSIHGYLPISPFQVFSWSGSGTVSITPKSSGGTWNVSGDVSDVRYGQIFTRT